MQPQAAREFYALQQRVGETTANEVRRIWRRHMGDDFDGSWKRVSPVILAVLAEGQAKVALHAGRYTRSVLDELNIPDRPEGDLRPESLVGRASDGRSLATLATQSVVTAKTAIGDGASTDQGLDAGGEWLHLMAQLQVADAARVAVGIGAASRRNIAGHVRVLNPPVCQRCAVLGGRFYRWSTGFDRHPRDDCTMMPVRSRDEASAFIDDPMDAFRAGHIKDLTEAQVKAIGEGADISHVVNAYRGMSTTATETAKSLRLRAAAPPRALVPARNATEQSVQDLLSGLSRGSQARTKAFEPILTPEGIYRVAGENRGEAIRLLKRHGYIT